LNRFASEYLLNNSKVVRLFHILRNPIFNSSATQRNHLIPGDFQPLLQALLETHEGLSFLKTTPAFQIKYSQTVLLRIFFSCTGRLFRSKRSEQMIMSLREFTSRQIGQVLLDLESCDNFPNGESRFFSYEHFYVIYCHFWELDSNHTFQIKLGQLGFTNYCMTRIKQEIGDGTNIVPSEMILDYADFVQIFLSVNDPNDSQGSFEFWWALFTPEKTQFIHLPTIKSFWNSLQQQLKEIQSGSNSHESENDDEDVQMDSSEGDQGPVSWPVIERQIKDLWNITDLTNIPKNKVRLACTNRDLGSNVFLMLSSVNGWLEMERTGGGIRRNFSDWAAGEYERLAAGDEEEEDEEVQDQQQQYVHHEELYDEELYDDVTMEDPEDEDYEMQDSLDQQHRSFS
jgi:hypothetical protein